MRYYNWFRVTCGTLWCVAGGRCIVGYRALQSPVSQHRIIKNECV